MCCWDSGGLRPWSRSHLTWVPSLTFTPMCMTCLHSLAVSHYFLIAANTTRSEEFMLLLSLAFCHWSCTLYQSPHVHVGAHSFCHLLQSGSAHMREFDDGQMAGAASALSPVRGCLHHGHAVYPSPGISASLHVKLWLHDCNAVMQDVCQCQQLRRCQMP